MVIMTKVSLKLVKACHEEGSFHVCPNMGGGVRNTNLL